MVQKCRPVHFNIRSGRKYIFYVKRVSAGRYVSVAIPDQLNRKSRKISKKLLCKNCGKLWVNFYIRNGTHILFLKREEHKKLILFLMSTQFWTQQKYCIWGRYFVCTFQCRLSKFYSTKSRRFYCTQIET